MHFKYLLFLFTNMNAGFGFICFLHKLFCASLNATRIAAHISSIISVLHTLEPLHNTRLFKANFTYIRVYAAVCIKRISPTTLCWHFFILLHFATLCFVGFKTANECVFTDIHLFHRTLLGIKLRNMESMDSELAETLNLYMDCR